MKPIKVVSIQRGCVYDGPGVRTTVFLKGCTLRCPWCCNPEAISYEDELFVDDTKCLVNKGEQSILCAQCRRTKGENEIKDCPFGVAKETSMVMTEEELLEQICLDESLYRTSEGGVTFSGGEPLSYGKELLPVLKELRTKSISIYVETSLCVSKELIEECKEYLDGVIVDLKLQPEMYLDDKTYISSIREKVMMLADKELICRLVFVNSMTNRVGDVISSLEQMCVKKLELISCHNLADAKYQQLGLKHVDYTADEKQYKKFADNLTKSNMDVTLLKI